MHTSSTEMLRLFVAVRPGEAAEELVRVQGVFRTSFASSGLRIKWTEPETFHITLLFLGRVPAADLADICRALEKNLITVSCFKTRLNGAGLFRKSGAFWAGVQPVPELVDLQKRIANALGEEGGWFHAHFTLGRIKSGRPDAFFINILEKTDVKPVELNIRSVELVKSDLSPVGARHTVIETIRLSRDS